MKILANDGIAPIGKTLIENAGIEIQTDNIPQAELKKQLNQFDGIIVRSATKIRKDLIDLCPNLKLICRGGVGMDNIDVDYARSKGIQVSNTPSASSTAVAELVFSHLFSTARFLHLSNREMPNDGKNNFKVLKKSYSKGIELNGKTIGIVGFGRIGQETARIAKGIGMKIIAFDIAFANPNFVQSIDKEGISIASKIEDLLQNSDFISLHVPANKSGKALLGKSEFEMMKTGIGIVNCARGGVINEKDLLEYLENGKIAFACLDVFENEPMPNEKLLNHPKISVSPHIGASTKEAQERIGIELANIVIDFAGNR